MISYRDKLGSIGKVTFDKIESGATETIIVELGEKDVIVETVKSFA